MKTHYSKLFIILAIILMSTCNVNAENWQEERNGLKIIYIDTDSVNFHNNSIYYNVKYYDEKIGEDIIATIQSKDNKAGIVSSCRYSAYKNNKTLINALTPKVATTFKPLNYSSLLFNANVEAKNIYKNSKNKNDSDSDNESSATDELNWNPYMRDLQRRIKRNWKPIKLGYSSRVVVLFTIGKNGELVSAEIYKTSGNKEMDEAALNTLKKTTFKPLLAGYNKQSIDIQFTFDYNVYNSQ